jgi:hypothetical protein
MSENEVVELSALGTSVDNQRLQVLTRSAEGKTLSASSIDVSMSVGLSSVSSRKHFCVLCPLSPYCLFPHLARLLDSSKVIQSTSSLLMLPKDFCCPCIIHFHISLYLISPTFLVVFLFPVLLCFDVLQVLCIYELMDKLQHLYIKLFKLH